MLKTICTLTLLLSLSDAEVEVHNLSGSIGLQTPVINVEVDKEFISHTELMLKKNQGETIFHFHKNAELPERFSISTTLPSLPLLPDSDHSDLPYNIYERVNEFTLQVDQSVQVITESKTYMPVMRWSSSLSEKQIYEKLNRFDIPLTFDLDEVNEVISNLSNSDKRVLKENRLITTHYDPNWSLELHVEIEIDKPSEGRDISVSYPQFPNNSYSSRPGELEDAFCATDNDSYVFMMISQHNGGVVPFTYHTLDLDGYINLTQLHLKTGRVEGTASCIEGDREYNGMDITIMNPTSQNGREASVMFFAP